MERTNIAEATRSISLRWDTRPWKKIRNKFYSRGFCVCAVEFSCFQKCRVCIFWFHSPFSLDSIPRTSACCIITSESRSQPLFTCINHFPRCFRNDLSVSRHVVPPKRRDLGRILVWTSDWCLSYIPIILFWWARVSFGISLEDETVRPDGPRDVPDPFFPNREGRKERRGTFPLLPVYTTSKLELDDQVSLLNTIWGMKNKEVYTRFFLTFSLPRPSGMRYPGYTH